MVFKTISIHDDQLNTELFFVSLMAVWLFLS